jgi:hypothetical protein
MIQTYPASEAVREALHAAGASIAKARQIAHGGVALARLELARADINAAIGALHAARTELDAQLAQIRPRSQPRRVA